MALGQNALAATLLPGTESTVRYAQLRSPGGTHTPGQSPSLVALAFVPSQRSPPIFFPQRRLVRGRPYFRSHWPQNRRFELRLLGSHGPKILSFGPFPPDPRAFYAG